MTKKDTKPRGFAYLKANNPKFLKEISAMGGSTGAGHRWTAQEARERGASGGRTRWAKQREKGKK